METKWLNLGLHPRIQHPSCHHVWSMFVNRVGSPINFIGMCTSGSMLDIWKERSSPTPCILCAVSIARQVIVGCRDSPPTTNGYLQYY